jgi:ribosomal protein S18 acetylase RimI-like enzyme
VSALDTERAIAELRPREFESSVLGRPVADLAVPAPDVENLDQILQRARSSGWGLVSCRIPVGWKRVAAALQASSFRHVETLVTFERPITPSSHGVEAVDVARTTDHVGCTAIARRAFRYDRFHADPLIPNDLADELKARWLENDLKGRADLALVVRDGKTPVGFNLCLLRDGVAVIDLIAVAPEAQKRGLAGALIRAALSHLAGRADVLRAATQDTNTASIGLYLSLGFRPICEQTTWHLTA